MIRTRVRAVPPCSIPDGAPRLGLPPDAMQETLRSGSPRSPAPRHQAAWDEWKERLARRTHPGAADGARKLVNLAVLMASDKASGVTGTTVNVAMGSLHHRVPAPLARRMGRTFD